MILKADMIEELVAKYFDSYYASKPYRWSFMGKRHRMNSGKH